MLEQVTAERSLMYHSRLDFSARKIPQVQQVQQSCQRKVQLDEHVTLQDTGITAFANGVFKDAAVLS